MIPDYKSLEEKIGYVFGDKELICEALTHSSYANEQNAKGKANVRSNERLEFLGDTVLSLVVSDWLYSEHPDFPEGKLTELRKAVVQSKSLAGFSKKISLGDFLLLGHGENKNEGRSKDKLLENAFEALLGAIYLDAPPGDKTETVAKFLLPLVKEELSGENADIPYDYKTELQQLVQKQSQWDVLSYETVGESGPDHDKTFEVAAKLNSNILGRGIGKTKREAEQNAAREALELFLGEA